MQREFAKRNVIPNASYSLYASKEGSLDYLFTGKHKQAFGLPRSCLTCTDMGNGDFLENNYKTQTISLVRKRFKLICFLTIRVQRTWFLVQPDRPRRPEIELKGLALPSWKSSSEDSLYVYGNRAQSTWFQFSPHLTRIFFSCSSKPQKPMNKSNPKQIKPTLHKNLRIAWSFRRLGLVRSTPGSLGFCIVAAARHVRSLRFALPEAFAAWVAGFLHCIGGETRPISAFCISWSFRRLGLVRIGAWVSLLLLSSSFWTLWVAGFCISPSLRY